MNGGHKVTKSCCHIGFGWSLVVNSPVIFKLSALGHIFALTAELLLQFGLLFTGQRHAGAPETANIWKWVPEWKLLITQPSYWLGKLRETCQRTQWRHGSLHPFALHLQANSHVWGGGPLPYQAVFVLITLMSWLMLLHACFRPFFLFVLVLCTGARCLFPFCSAPMVYPHWLPAWNTYSSVPSCSCKRKNATEKGLSILSSSRF